jgi:hypothetical protein
MDLYTPYKKIYRKRRKTTTQDKIYEVRNTGQPKEKNNQKPKDNKETATSSNRPTTPPTKSDYNRQMST